MEVIEVPIKKLKFADYNPRIHPDIAIDKLVKSIEHFGFTNPVLVQKSSWTILAGHARIKAAVKHGMTKVPVVLLDLDDAQAMAYNIADNRLQDETSFDFSSLADLLLDLDTGFFDMRLTGFDLEEIEDIMTWTPEADDVKEDDFDGEVPENPISKPGDLFRLGRHIMLCGDATKAADVDRVIGTDRVTAIWTDPPYGVGYQDNESKASLKKRNRRTDGKVVAGDNLSEEEIANLIESSLGNVAGHSNKGAVCYLAAPAGHLLPYFIDGFNRSGFRFKHSLVWVKDRFVFGRSDYHYRHELVLYGWLEGKHIFGGGRSLDSVFEVKRPGASPDHPTQKPMTLVARMIANSSKNGQIICDPFLGSGTTMMVCETLGLACRGIELKPGYCDVAVNRWAKFRGMDPAGIFAKAERPNGS